MESMTSQAPTGGENTISAKFRNTIYNLYGEKKEFNFNKLSPDEKKEILHTQRTERSGFISRSIQTDSRESETQTDPYSPPYKIQHPGSYPKVLALAKLSWGKGLPFTLEDIVVIERALSKRILERTNRLTEAENDKEFENRIKLMEQLEAQQWADREKELEKVLDFKMEVTARLLNECDGKLATENTMRLERLQTILRAKNSIYLKYVKHQYFRNLRKLERKYIIPKPSRKRNIIKDYTEFDSKIYAPLVRNGTSIDNLNSAPPFQMDIQRDFEGLKKLTDSKTFIRREIYFDIDAFRDRIKQCEPSQYKQRLERKLTKIYNNFKDWTLPKKNSPFDNLDLTTREEKGRFAGPFIELDGEGDNEERERRPHCVTLQKIGRGRVIQKIIRKDMEDNMEELIGLKQMFDLDPNCQRIEEGQMQKLLSMKKHSESDSKKDSNVEVNEVLGHLEGESLNKMLTFLDTEMIRLIDERKVHALVLLAERERRRKEAMEAGRRHREEENRRKNDEMFRHIVGIHQSTVDIYLEEIFIEACDRVADEESRSMVRHMATTINEAQYALPSELGEFEMEEMAAELVSTCIVPELSRLRHQERLDAAQARYKKL